MNRWLLAIDKVHQKSEIFVVYLSGLFVLLIMVLTSLEVCLRKFANTSIPGVLEITAQLMVGIGLLGVSYVQQKKEHISVDIISNKLPRSFLKISDLFIYLLGLFITGVFCWQGFVAFSNSFMRNEYVLALIKVPVWPGKLIVAVSMLLIVIRFLLDIVHYFIPPVESQQ